MTRGRNGKPEKQTSPYGRPPATPRKKAGERPPVAAATEVGDVEPRLAAEIESNADFVPQQVAIPEVPEIALGATSDASRNSEDLDALGELLDQRAIELHETQSKLEHSRVALLEEIEGFRVETAEAASRIAIEREALSRDRDSLRAERQALETQVEAQKAAAEDLAKRIGDFETERIRGGVNFLEGLAQEVQRGRGAAEMLLQSVLDAETSYLAAVDRQSASFANQLEQLTMRAAELVQQDLNLAMRGAKIEAAEAAERRWRSEFQTAVERASNASTERVAELERELDELRTERRQMHKDLLAARTAGERAGVLDALIAEIRQDRDRLAIELEARPAGEGTDSAIVHDLRRRNRELEAELDATRSSLYQLETRVSKGDSAQADLQLANDKVDALERVKKAYRQTVTDLRADVDDLLTRRDGRVPFHACSEMDLDEELNKPATQRRATGELDLKELGLYLQVAMASTADPRYYDLDHIAIFLGGLASSPLLVVQGLSGTGKTSLPIAVASALGWEESKVIEVASGWRDPQDLLGYYNAFERRFHETEVMKALYRAGRPARQSQGCFLILDEMNLSHPEYYFGDFLSALEKPGLRKSVPLQLPDELTNLPRGLDQGRLPIPPNVWFIGTSNKDETTVSLSDKVHDRAHVMELPTRFPTFAGKPRKPPVPMPLDLAVLRQAFSKAHTQHQAVADDAAEALQTAAEPLAEFGIAWGNRLPQMMRRFVPVVIAAGSSPARAMDHILSTKVLRKVEGRYDLTRSDLDKIEAQLAQVWAISAVQGEPQVWPRLIEREKRRKGIEG